jgi:hypothetical protein
MAALNLTGVAQMARLWADEMVRQPLVIPFTVIMGHEILNGGPQRGLSDKIRRSKQHSLMLRTNLSP